MDPDSAVVREKEAGEYNITGSYVNIGAFGTTHYVIAFVETSTGSMGNTEDDGVFPITVGDRTLYVHPYSIVSDEWYLIDDEIF